MLLNTPFVQLPYRFDTEHLRVEVEALPDDAWRRHPTGHQGNTAVGLINRHGDHTDDAIGGVHAPTTWLAHDSYLAQTIASFGVPVGRTRLMRIDPGGEAIPHFDMHAYWFDRVRIHVPILTTDAVIFQCGDAEVHMPAGESWVFDTFRRHNVLNPGDTYRVHLVIDTVGSPALWRAIDHGGPPVEVPWAAGTSPVILTERAEVPAVATPGQLESYAWRLHPLFPEIQAAAAIRRATDEFITGWRTLWSIHGPDGGITDYTTERQRFADELEGLDDVVIPYNGSSAKRVTQALFVETAVAPEHRVRPAAKRRSVPASLSARPAGADDRFDRPVIIVSPPRAGSTLLFETLAQAPDAFTIGKESHMLIESIPSLHPQRRGWDSNVLTSDDATEPVVQRLRDLFFADLRDRRGTPPPMNGRFIRIVEKTPKNALRIEFMDRVFPDARFIFLSRNARDEVSSMMDAWRSGGFVTYPDLPDWEGLPWSLLLIPGWQDLIGKPLEEICARQWEYTTNRVLDDLERVAPGRWTTADYDRVVAEPNQELKRLCKFAGLRWDANLDSPLPLARHTLTPPDPEKWRRNEAALAKVLPDLEQTERRARRMADTAPSAPPAERVARRRQPARTDGRLSSVHTAGLAELLGKADATVVLSTYQSGSLISIRMLDGTLNTHFTRLPRPMGIARSHRGTLAIGTNDEVWRYRNQPAVAQRLQPEGTYGSCYVLHDRHHTGNVAIHELAYDHDHELWIVATRFSCLATLDADNSFVPRWRPSFVTELRADDRCHLNGLAMRHGRPRYVTAFAESDVAQGWRDTKAFGGLIIDMESDEIMTRGLCMPHSPRWYRDQLWVLESGKGSLSRVDPESGDAEVVATLPGFTRGLAFIDRYALVGLSKVRESVFDGVPLTKSSEPLHSGLWVVDIETGAVVAFMRFDGSVSEVFDVWVDRTPGHLHIVDLTAEQHANSFLIPGAV